MNPHRPIVAPSEQPGASSMLLQVEDLRVASRAGSPLCRALLAAVPRGQPRRDASPVPRVLIEGDLPDPTHPPSGCAFHGRCPHVQARCRQEAPALMPRVAGVDHRVACHIDIVSSSGERNPAAVASPDDHRVAVDAAARDRLRLLMNAFIRPPGQ